MARQLQFLAPMSRVISLAVSVLLHGGSAALLITWGLGGYAVPDLAVNATPTVPSALDFAERTLEIEFSTPSLNPPKLQVEEVPPVELEHDPEPAEKAGQSEADVPVVPAEKPAPEFGRPLPAAAASARLAAPANTPQLEAENVAIEVYTPPPRYPSGALRRKIEGYVVIELTVLPDGTCTDAKIVEQSDYPEFGPAALDSVRQWKFQPAMQDGKPVSCTHRVRFTFKLRG